MAKGKKIGTYQISPDCVVTEMISTVHTGKVYDYYINDEYVFGVENRFSIDDLTALYNSGYFDFWLIR